MKAAVVPAIINFRWSQ